MKKTKTGFTYKDRKYQKTNVQSDFNFYQEEITASVNADVQDKVQGVSVAKLQKQLEDGDITEDEYQKALVSKYSRLSAALFELGLNPKVLAVMYYPKDDEMFNPNKKDAYGETYEDRVEFFKAMPTKFRQELEEEINDFFTNAAKSIAVTSRSFSAGTAKTEQEEKSSKKKG